MGLTTSPQDRLVAFIAELPSCLIAFSGGVDSAVVAKAASLALGEKAIAVTGVSASLAGGELELAQRIAKAIGIRHETVATDEFSQDGYLENQPNRCWHCKTELYERLQALGNELDDEPGSWEPGSWEPGSREPGNWQILNGANTDDTGDFRPGMKAATEHQVRSPLIECGIDKATVRKIAQVWNLEVWDKPATPCLASRVVYGLEITTERLVRIDAAEQLLRELGLENVRVRHHHDDLARLEVNLADLPALCEEAIRSTLTRHLRELGFRYVTIDLEGFRSGSFQQLVPADELSQYSS